jgi:phosphate/sulfate permease
MIDVNIVTFAVIFAGLVGAIIWDLITWYFGLPTSSSHALFGGYAGAAVAKAGWSAILVAGWTKTLVFIVLSPLIGSVGARVDDRDLSGCSVGCRHHVWTAGSAARSWFRPRFFSLNHGANDAQKTMGIIAGVLFAPVHRKIRHSFLGRAVRRTRQSASAPWRAVGGSSTRWDRRSRNYSRSVGSRRKPARRCLS